MADVGDLPLGKLVQISYPVPIGKRRKKNLRKKSKLRELRRGGPPPRKQQKD